MGIVFPNRERIWIPGDIEDLAEKARALGILSDDDPYVKDYTVGEIDFMVRVRQ